MNIRPAFITAYYHDDAIKLWNADSSGRAV